MAKGSNPNASVGFWHMCRDVLVASMNKGQFPIALAAAVILSLVWRLPQEDVSKLVFGIGSELKSGSLVGWVLCATLAVGWFLHAKHQRRVMTDEISRISKERNAAQEKLLGQTLASTKPKR